VPVVAERLTEELCAEIECTPEFLDFLRTKYGEDGPEQFAAVMRDPKTEERAAEWEAVRALEEQGIEVGPPEGFTVAEWEKFRKQLPPPTAVLISVPAVKFLAQPRNGRAPRRPRSRSPRRQATRSSSAASRDGPDDDPDDEPSVRLQPGQETGCLGVEAPA
jgi:hypothetical protein